MASINLNENETINVELGKQSSSLNTTLNDINYIPSYKEAETERRINEVNRMVNENNREEYINDLKERVSNGEFNGKDGAIQYKAGKGIEIKNEIISTTGESGGGTWGSITGTLSDQTDLKAALDNKAETSNIPTKVSDLNNDSEFITIAVNNLTNYYKKTEIYTQEEVNALISNINSFNVEVVQILPTKNIDTHTIYLVPKESETDDNYNEYIYINNSWEHIGSTNVDLTNYYNKTEIDTKLTDINEIVISETQPAPGNAKIWINTGEISPMHSEVVNSLSGNETAKAPSVQAVNNKFNEISAYSTEEKVIGTWINGKKLYEKTIYINTGSTADTDVVIANLNIDNIEYLKITDGSIFSNNNWWDVNFYYSNTIYAATYIRPEENAIKGKYGSYILGTGYITINYTRTTDSATKTINEEPISEEATI